MKRILLYFTIMLLGVSLYSQDTIPVSLEISVKDTTITIEQPQDTAIKKSEKRMQNIDEQLTQKPSEVLDAISFSKIFWTIVLLAIGYFMIRFIIKLLEVFAERSVRYRISIKSMIPIVRIVIWTIIIFAVVKGIYNPPLETLIAMTASVAIAVGLAAQDLLKNVFGGIMLLFDRPFQVGDKIETGKYYGEVLEIGLRATRIVTPDDSVVSVPNMELMNTSVSNSNSGELNCQVVAEIYLPIDVDTQKVRKIAIEAAQVSKYIYLNKPIVALFFNEVKQRRSYLKMRLKAYVMDIRFEFQFKSDMTEIVIKELLAQGVIQKDDLF
jgi:small-conductance mechanosensitive channel